MFAVDSRSMERCLLCCLLLVASFAAIAEKAADPRRGLLLYDTHCIACHTTDVHWRDKHIVQSWPDLIYQVNRMQGNAGQNWEQAEIIDVAAYLNEVFYQMPCPVPGCGGSEARVDQRPALARLR